MAEPRKKVLCPIEFDASFNQAIAIARELVQKNGGVLYLMHVVAPFTDPLVISGALRPQHDVKVVRAELERIAREQLGDTPHELLIRIGDPADEVLRAERELGVDTVVMPTHRHHEFFRLLSDGVSHKVIDESTCTVISVPERVWGKDAN
jgi:universal stress protein A